MRRVFLIITILIAQAFLLFSAPAARALDFAEIEVENVPAVQAADGDAVDFAVRPYVQNMTTTSVVIMWQTNKPAKAQVRISKAQSDDRSSDAAVYDTNTARCLNELHISGLEPDSVYNYRVKLSESEAAADAQFRTFPTKQRPVRFVVYGDSGRRPERHKKVIDAMAGEKDLDFVLLAGDIVGSGWPDEWIPEFFEPAAKITCSVPFFTALGNHENNSPFYFRYFSLPMEERWYSFDVLDVHVVVLDSNTDFDEGSEQYRWLIEDLQKHKHKKWKFVVTHHSAFTSGWHGAIADDGLPKETPIRAARKLFPKLAEDYGIAAFFAGHDHRYEHSMVDGSHYVISGGGGSPGCKDMGAEVRRNELGGIVCVVLHYCVVTVDGETAKLTARGIDSQVIDAFEMTSPVE